MRGLWLEGGRLELRTDLPEPEVRAGEAVIRMRLAGVCATDLELRRGYAPFTGVPGHELVGEVVAAPGAERWVGRRVVGEINASCGECPTCRAGRRRHCPTRTVVGIVGRMGAFAERLALPVANLHEVPHGVSDDAAVFCEPLAAALEITEQVHLRPTDRVLLVGAGRLGQLIARVVARCGCATTVVVRRERQALLLGGLGVEVVRERDLAELDLFDVVIEASGSPEGWALARSKVRPGGVVVLKSTYAGRLELDASALVVDEITVVGSRCGPFEPALGLLESGAIEPRPLIDARFPLSRGVEAIEHAAQRGVNKVLVTFDEEGA